MSNRKSLRRGGEFVRKTVNNCRINLRPWVNKCRVLGEHFFAKSRPPDQGDTGVTLTAAWAKHEQKCIINSLIFVSLHVYSVK
jgi:hypothetical protein